MFAESRVKKLARQPNVLLPGSCLTHDFAFFLPEIGQWWHMEGRVLFHWSVFVHWDKNTVEEPKGQSWDIAVLGFDFFFNDQLGNDTRTKKQVPCLDGTRFHIYDDASSKS